MLKIDLPAISLQNSPKSYPLVMVASHERSGTHFLMNSISKNAPLSTAPFVNLDLLPFGSIINFASAPDIDNLFQFLESNHCSSIIKSHFASEFFDSGILRNGNRKVLYVFRNPFDVMKSYKNLIDSCDWNEGPRTPTLKEFILSEPSGQMLRYQQRQARTVLQRWERHVLGWLKLAEKSQNVKCVYFDDLLHRHADETRSVIKFIGVDAPDAVKYPAKNENVVEASKLYPVSAAEEVECRKIINSGIESDILRRMFRLPG